MTVKSRFGVIMLRRRLHCRFDSSNFFFIIIGIMVSAGGKGPLEKVNAAVVLYDNKSKGFYLIICRSKSLNIALQFSVF